MKRLKQYLLPILVISMVIAGTASVVAQTSKPRIFYDALFLDTPENAVQSFVDAFHREDYVAVMAIFSVET